MAKTEIALRYNTPGRDCPVCGTHTKGCSLLVDGLQFCRIDTDSPGDEWKFFGRDQHGFGRFRRVGDKRTKGAKGGKSKPSGPSAANEKITTNAAAWTANLNANWKYAEGLGRLLGGIPDSTFRLFQLGLKGTIYYGPDEPGHDQIGGLFTIPERNGAGLIVGCATRFEFKDRALKAVKKSVFGGDRGLTIPDGWMDRPGPLFLVEGFTDTAAMTACGLSCVGRPNNLAGVDDLAELLADWPAERAIVVVGDNDEEDGLWPGREGAMKTASELARKLNRIVLWTLPPDKAKDVREWLTARSEEWSDRGALLVKGLMAAAVSEAEGPPEIIITPQEFDVNDQACSALGFEPDLYQRGGLLVHVVEIDRDESQGSVKRSDGIAKIQLLKPPSLRERMARCALWSEWRGTGDDRAKVETHPPKWSVEAVFHRGEWPRVRSLRAVVTHPVVNPGGEILASNGYDPKTQLLVKIPYGLTVSVPESPTKTHVDEAIATLNEVIQDFPFQSDVYKSAWYAALFTPLMWYAFDGPAPLFLFDANTRAAGKGKLTNIIHNIINGNDFSISNYTHNKEEMRKVITTFAVNGDRMVLLDNIVGSFGNDLMAGVLTTDRWKDRILGGNQDYNGPINVTWYATGNNVQLVSDLGRRVCHIRLETPLENPENRNDYKHKDIIGYTRTNRNSLLSAALTIIRYWYTSGQPRANLKNWGSYEQWSIIRDILVHAGMPDPGEARDELLNTSDEDVNLVTGLIAGMEIMDPLRRGMSSSEIISHLVNVTKEPGRYGDLPGGSMPRQAAEEMKGVIIDLCGKLCPRQLGYRFKHFRKRSFHGKFIDKVDNNNNNRWVVKLRTSQVAKDMESVNSLMSLAPQVIADTDLITYPQDIKDMKDIVDDLYREG